MAYSPDGKMALTGSQDRTARLWDVATSTPIGPPMVHQGYVYSVAYSPDGRTVLTGSEDHTARLWDAAAATPIGQPLLHDDKVSSVAYTPDGKAIITEAGRMIRLWDVATTQPIGRSIAKADPVSYSPDGKTIVVWGPEKALRLWDAATGQPIGPPLQYEGVNPRGSYALAFSPDGMTVVTTGYSDDASDADRPATDPNPVRVFHLPPLVDEDFSRIEIWVKVITSQEVDHQGNISALDSRAWRDRREQLRKLGGTPKSDSEWLVDPILHGSDPTVRACAWLERKRWAEAEAAFAEVLRTRPLPAVWAERGRYYITRSELGKAAADFVQALSVGRGDPKLLGEIIASDSIFDHTLARAVRQAAGVASSHLSTCASIMPNATNGPGPSPIFGMPPGSRLGCLDHVAPSFGDPGRRGP